ncbi:MAG: PIN domain-containing protein [bacterium]|nr:PIN domain-containing protein [bacterium]
MAKRRQPRLKKVFLDSSVFFTAVKSPYGGSARLFVLKNIQLVASRIVLAEVEKNVRRKLESYHLERFFLLARLIEIPSQKPNKTLIAKAEKAIVKKDAVILAEAKQAKTDMFITLDKKHFLTDSAKSFLIPQKIITPEMFFSSNNDSLLKLAETKIKGGPKDLSRKFKYYLYGQRE